MAITELRNRKPIKPSQLFKKKAKKPATTEDTPVVHTSYLNRVLIALFFILPWAGVIAQQGYTLDAFLQTLGHVFHFAEFKESMASLSFLTKEFGLLLLALSTPHVYYHLIWIFPKSFHSFIKNLGFEPLLALGKDLNPETLAEETKNATSFLISYVAGVHLFKWIFLAQTVIMGQILNLTVYKVLGEVGVYYGARLEQEHRIEWVTGFPYNTLSHGQYVGATLTILGVIGFLGTPELVSKGIYAVALTMVSYYGFSSFSESTY
eukprot:snap_masked-scaffold_5-processed-gene-14.28-mRNA-1 protein AED:0.12 eAED:1.00 QI:0/0/0/1/1/1/2/0/263